MAVENELQQLGVALRLARRRRGMTQGDVASRLEVDPRVVAKLERGDPTVSLGACLQAMDLFGLLAGLSRLLDPDADVEAAMADVRAARAGTRPLHRRREFSDEEMDF